MTELIFKNVRHTITLSQKLYNCKKELLAVDEKIEESIKGTITFANKNWNEKSNDRLLTDFLSEKSTPYSIVYLSSLQNNLAMDENQLLSALLSQTAKVAIIDTWIEAIVGQNSKVLEVGDELEITAGLGSFSSAPKPVVEIMGQIVALNEKNLAVEKVKTSKTPGNFKLPVVISFTDQDGKTQTRTFTVEYKTVSLLNKK